MLTASRTRRAPRGFTLIELLVVIAIIAILAAILFPVFAKAREKARQTACLSNMNQLGKAMEMYKSDFDTFYPPATVVVGSLTAGGAQRAWPSLIYSYVQSQGVYVCPSATDAGQGTDPVYYGTGNMITAGVTEDTTIPGGNSCTIAGQGGALGGDGSTLNTWGDGTQSTLVHRLSYSRNMMPDSGGSWNSSAASPHPGGTWGSNGTTDAGTNLHKSGFCGASSLIPISEAKVETPATTIQFVDNMVFKNNAGGPNCFSGVTMRALTSEDKLDYNHASNGTNTPNEKPSPRHSDGFNVVYGDTHTHWVHGGATKPCDWTIQDDTCP